jgi:hypothetical protein
MQDTTLVGIAIWENISFIFMARATAAGRRFAKGMRKLEPAFRKPRAFIGMSSATLIVARGISPQTTPHTFFKHPVERRRADASEPLTHAFRQRQLTVAGHRLGQCSNDCPPLLTADAVRGLPQGDQCRANSIVAAPLRTRLSLRWRA